MVHTFILKFPKICSQDENHENVQVRGGCRGGVRATRSFYSSARAGGEAVAENDKKADARSIMKILMLSASQGTYIKVQINGENQDNAMSSIEKLFNEKFNEEE